ncbi:OB-fold domain-containing protein [Acrocarpospora macrocephala]|uniref:DNA-binding protein n=1 Tax=Acrocarpospora macrocephala TaxID=150177 RepID=A0A5M3X4M5_9ACTN|nr:OB-fold domain-containing protein [Acrocarpospora macrocephala]GES13088.1 hypothetical protein Amac_066850 [Acrocarpospora macrocephala]
MSEISRPVPVVTEENRPFWEGLAEGRLLLQRCSGCGHPRYPIALVCPRCLSKEHGWEAMSGRGTVFSSVVFHQVYHPAFADRVPYNVAMVELDEGPLIMTNVVGTDQVTVGMPVQVIFTAIEGAVIHQFVPRDPE